MASNAENAEHENDGRENDGQQHLTTVMTLLN